MKAHHWLLLAAAIIAIFGVNSMEYNEKYTVTEKIR